MISRLLGKAIEKTKKDEMTFLNYSTHPHLLKEEIESSGKSIFLQQLYQQLWKDYQHGGAIPLWISLPELIPLQKGSRRSIKKIRI